MNDTAYSALVTSYINTITLTGRTIVPINSSTSTPEDRALKWLIDSDPNKFVPTTVTSTNNTRIQQRYALLTLWFQHNDTARPWQWGFFTNWLTNPNECTWYGITCGTSPPNTTNVIQKINWNGYDLYCTIPIEFGLLSSITHFAARSIDIYGTIPSSLSLWTNIINVDLSYNAINGTIPSGLGNWTNIETVNIAYSSISGTLPTTIGQWSKLRSLFAWSNRFTGTIPPSIFINCAQLSAIDVEYNDFTGTIPNLFSCPMLSTVSLSGNRFNGTIPQSLGNLTRLQRLEIGGNEFSGTLPPMLLDQLTNFSTFAISWNRLSGTISPSLGNMTRLTTLNLANNNFTGALPSTLVQLTALASLDISSNRLSGTIPLSLGNITRLTKLSLANNNFSGTLASTLMVQLTALSSLDISSNRLSGTIPSSIGTQWTALTSLDLSDNQLQGSLPESIGSWTLLVHFDVKNNQLTGSIPSSIANWTRIFWVYFNANLFNGTVPIGICNYRLVLYADCPTEVICWCCSGCPAPPTTKPPTRSPTRAPTRTPTRQPTRLPTHKPPVVVPVSSPTAPLSTRSPTRLPTKQQPVVVMPIAPPPTPIAPVSAPQEPPVGVVPPPTNPVSPVLTAPQIQPTPPTAPLSTRSPTRLPTKQQPVVVVMPVAPPPTTPMAPVSAPQEPPVGGVPPQPTNPLTPVLVAPQIQPTRVDAPQAIPTPTTSPMRAPTKPINIITFSEFPSRTPSITNQYAASNGVIFGPDTAVPFFDIVAYADQSLSGFPFTKGDISGYFVQTIAAGMYQNSTVKSFNLTVYSYGRVGSTRVEWFDPSGAIINQLTNQRTGAEQFVVQGGNIASFRVGIIDREEQTGFVIDNFIATPGTSGILFRQLRADAQDGSWGPDTINIPGFDHVALSYLDSVYESHPGYTNGPIYVSADGSENRSIALINGVQNVHSRATFQHNSPKAGTTPVIEMEEIPIDDIVAVSMKNAISAKVRKSRFLAFNTIEEFVSGHVPDAQKGRDNAFSGCGLIEWAAEQAGVNRGQGFVPNALESITTPNGVFPMLSPQLLYYALQNQELVFSTIQTIKGYFDPVDYVVTDPLGRRSGLINRTRYNEIPNAVPTPKGDVETLVISNPVPGQYMIRVVGIPGQKGVAALEVSNGPTRTVRTTGNATSEERSLEVPVVSGSRGDVNGDGKINPLDLDVLRQRITIYASGIYAPGIADTGDMNGDRELNQADVNLLKQYLDRLSSPTRPPTRAPTKAPILEVTPNGECPTTDKCSRGFRMHRVRSFLFSGCSEVCVSKQMTQIRLRRSRWKCGPCPFPTSQ